MQAFLSHTTILIPPPQIIVCVGDDIRFDGKGGESPASVLTGVKFVGSSGSVEMASAGDVENVVVHRNQNPILALLAA